MCPGGGPSVVACHVNPTVICVVVVTELTSAWCLLACDWWILVQCDNLSCDAKKIRWVASLICHVEL